MRPHQAFSHLTAAELWGMPLPRSGGPLHVMAMGERGRMRRPGVVGWERSEVDLVVRRRFGLPVFAPADVWCQLASELPREWFVAAGDFLLSGARTDRGREQPLCTRDELHAAIRRHGRRRGARALAEALSLLRSPVDSPRETLLRLALTDGGLPEPVVQPAIMTAAGILHSDLGYLEERLLLEYQGDEHRTSRARWLKDLTRVQLFEDAGYRVMLVGAHDVDGRSLPLVQRVRRALSRAS